MADVETAVIGGGVVGLAIAKSLSEAGREVLVLEQHERVGEETSSRNSEVIHAGLYYPQGSLKAQLCIEGKGLLYRFAEDNGVPVNRCGKLLVATSAAEIGKLEAIVANARACGVADLVPLAQARARKLEPAVACAAAYLSPSTGVIDSHAFMTALEGHIQSRGGTMALSSRVDRIERTAGAEFLLHSISGDETTTLSCRQLVIAAGLWSSELARQLFAPGAQYQVPPTRYAKGHYFTLSGKAPFSHLVYPMPVDGGLGVHLTLDMGGGAKFGPDVSWIERIDYAFDDEGGRRRDDFITAIRQWWPDLPAERLIAGYTGIRPKLSGPGEAVADFAIHGPKAHSVDGLCILYGIESPGLTSSLAIGRRVAHLLALGY